MINSKIITLPCSDLKTVNSARVSMDVVHEVFKEKGDTGLINYLARHLHWTPFAHNREVIFFPVDSKVTYYHLIEMFGVALSPEQQASMVIQANLHTSGIQYIAVKTSLYGWASVIKHLHTTYFKNDGSTVERILSVLNAKYPVGFKALISEDIIATYKLSDKLVNRNADVYSKLVRQLEPKMFDITFYETVPIFVARQRFKHVIITVYNEISRRYVDSIPVMFRPIEWRLRPEKSIKQGSGGIHPDNDKIMQQYDDFCKVALQFYDKLVNHDKVAPEMARILLPQGMMTEYYVTSNIDAWDRFVAQRKDGHAQKEIQDLASITETHLAKAKRDLEILLNDPSKQHINIIPEMNKLGIF